jgi:hypothetical protein
MWFFIKLLPVGAWPAPAYVLIRGVVTMARGGMGSSEQQQQWMRRRVMFQAIAIIIVVLILLLAGTANR